MKMSKWIPVQEKFIEIDPDKCTGCGRCVTICAAECFKMVEGKATVSNLDNCFECYACAIVCKPGALQWKVPKGGTGVVYEYG